MKCPQCQAEVNPTLVYCSTCGCPMDVDVADVLEDDERRREETRLLQAVRDAKGLLVLAGFLLLVAIALRVVLLKKRDHDHVPAFRAPTVLVDDAGIDPRADLPIEPVTIPLPEDS